jgi:hypothetical protein
VRNARRTYEFAPPPELRSSKSAHHPVIIAGAGPVGRAAARDLAPNGKKSNNHEKRSGGSAGARAHCSRSSTDSAPQRPCSRKA